MRLKNSIKNTIANILLCVLNSVLGMVSVSLFLKILDVEYLGINGLFSNIILFLNIAELGIGDAIVVSLYKPIRENDIESIKSLMAFYKKAYNAIALVVLAIGLSLVPFLKYIVGNVNVPVNLTIVYLLYLFSTVSSYLLVYKRSIIYADQKDYILKIIEMFYVVICNILQIIMLYLTKNYYLYLIIKILCQLIENIIISIIANNRYSYLKSKNIKKQDKKIKKDILKRISALSLHQISYFIINGTDNIIISHYLGIIKVGIYSNYTTIFENVKKIFSKIISSTVASVGDLLAEGNQKNIYKIFKKIKLLNIWITVFSSICLLIITQDFIKLWIGKKYLLSNFTLLVLVVNFYQKLLQKNYKVFKEAGGIWWEDKFVPIIESILNILFSLVLLKVFGLAGIFMGTIISSLPYWFYSYPIFIYKGLFKRSYWKYILEMLEYIILFVFIGGVTYFVASLFVVKNLLLQVFVDLIVCIIIPNILLLLIYRKTDEFRYFFNLMKNIFFKRKIY